MFELFGLLIEAFVWLWILIIASVPNIFMGGLTFCAVATVMTYFLRRDNT